MYRLKALYENERIHLLSSIETESLKIAIKIKQKKIKLLENSLKTNKEDNPSLSNSQKRNLNKHFNKKIKFYKAKESTDWRLWPKKYEKPSKKEKSRREKYLTYRNVKRKQKEIERRAKHHIEGGDVRILVDFDVPPEAVAVLGKGLGFVPTPSQDISELRLDARRTANKVAHFANNLEWSSETTDEDVANPNSTVEPAENSPFSLPKKLRVPNYFQARLHSTDPEMNMAIQHITTQAKQRSNQLRLITLLFKRSGAVSETFTNSMVQEKVMIY